MTVPITGAASAVGALLMVPAVMSQSSAYICPFIWTLAVLALGLIGTGAWSKLTGRAEAGLVCLNAGIILMGATVAVAAATQFAPQRWLPPASVVAMAGKGQYALFVQWLSALLALPLVLVGLVLSRICRPSARVFGWGMALSGAIIAVCALVFALVARVSGVL